MYKQRDKFSIIIQGPIHECSLNNIENYKLFSDDIIISTWSDSQKEDILKKYISSGVKVVLNQNISIQGIYNHQNTYYQCYTVLAGVSESKNKYVIKVRSDESFSDLTKFCEQIILYPEKLTTTNIYFTLDKISKYHASDHLIGSTRENILNTYLNIKELCELGSIDPMKGLPIMLSDFRKYNCDAEQILTIGFLKTKFIPIFWDESSKSLIKKYINIVNLNNLGETKYTSNAYGVYQSTSKDIIVAGEIDQHSIIAYTNEEI